MGATTHDFVSTPRRPTSSLPPSVAEGSYFFAALARQLLTNKVPAQTRPGWSQRRRRPQARRGGTTGKRAVPPRRRATTPHGAAAPKQPPPPRARARAQARIIVVEGGAARRPEPLPVNSHHRESRNRTSILVENFPPFVRRIPQPRDTVVSRSFFVTECLEIGRHHGAVPKP